MLALAGLGLRLLGQNPDKEPDTVTEEEIRMLVTVGEEKGAIEQSERQMINNIFEFDDRFVTEVMTHRMEMTALEDTATLDEAVAVARQTGYSRIPVYHEDIDNITGVLYAKDLLGFVNDRNNSEGFELRKMLHRAFFIPDTAKCTELFREFQQKQLHMAIVIDEYGGTYGMVTMEDLLEAIVGDIQDEYDREESEYQKISDTEYDIDGRLPLDDVEELLGADLPEDSDYDTIGGVIVDRLEGLPANGEHPSVQIGRVLFTVLEVSDRRIAKLRAQLLPEEPPGRGGALEPVRPAGGPRRPRPKRASDPDPSPEGGIFPWTNAKPPPRPLHRRERPRSTPSGFSWTGIPTPSSTRSFSGAPASAAG